MFTLPPALASEFTPETLEKLEKFLNEFVVATSHDMARILICEMLIAEKRHILQELK